MTDYEERARHAVESSRVRGPHEVRMRALARAQVYATLHLADRVDALADRLTDRRYRRMRRDA